MVASYSATAPMFLPEDEKRERSSLSAEERKAIEADLKGNQEFEETEEMRRTGIQSLHDAMNDDVETMDKAAYLEACAQVPELVERESSPIAFLRSEQYDGKAAATRLAEYWKQRRSCFGKKAFEPMTMDGALSSDQDLETLAVGCMVILPDEELGRGVIFLDGAVATTLPRNSVLRVWFYLLHVLTSRENVQKRGYVLINNIKGFDVSRPFDRILAKRSMAIVQSAMPAQLRVAHACLGVQLRAIQLVAPQSKQLAGKHIRMRSVRHAGTNEEILDSMHAYGLVRKNMSPVLGGDFTHEDFLVWLDRRRGMEEGEDPEAP